MKKRLMAFAILSACFVGLNNTSVARCDEGADVAATPTKITFKEPDERAVKVASLCKAVMESYSENYRVRTAEEDIADSTPELEEAEREYFNANCSLLVEAFADYCASGSDAAFEEIVRALGEINHYQSNSPAVAQLMKYVREYFALPNFYVEASERFISAMARRRVVENFSIREYIRETFARGNGVAHGVTSVDLHPNTERAEIAIVLKANVSTKTVGTSRGVDVYTDNDGSVVATKTIYVNPNGTLTTTLGAASGNMKSRLNSFNANRITPFGGAIIQKKIDQELPLSERESTNRVNQRVAAELESQTNAEILELNRRVERMTENGVDPMIRSLTTRTSDNRLFLSCVVGRSQQLAAPTSHKDRAVEFMRRLSEETKLAKASVNAPYSREYNTNRTVRATSGTVAPAFAPAPSRQGPVGALLTAPLTMVNEFATAINPSAARTTNPYAPNVLVSQPVAPAPTVRVQTPKPVEQTAPSEGGFDVVARMHQSGPNNAVTVALAGAVFGPDSDNLESVVARFPALDIEDIKSVLTPYEPKEARPLEPDDNYQNVSIRFDEVRPFLTRFADGKISTVMRISSCVVDGAEYPPVEVHFVYHVEKRGDSYAFVRETIDVLPEGYQEGDSVSARFHTFRRIFIKRLEKNILDEYVVVPISLDDKATGERRGALIPEAIDSNDGWFTIAFRYDPNYSAN